MAKASSVAVALSALAAALAGAALWRSFDNAGLPGPRTANAHETTRSLEPSLGDTMTRVQGLFADLYYAADAKNWALASYHLHELEETFERVPVVKPEENGVQLKPLVDIVLGTTIPELEKTVEEKDLGSFLNRYMATISTCNACHVQTGHAYLVVQTPEGPATKVLNRTP